MANNIEIKIRNEIIEMNVYETMQRMVNADLDKGFAFDSC